MLQCRRNFAVIVLVIVVPCKRVIDCHAKFLQDAGNFVCKARSHTNYGFEPLELCGYFFNLRKINCSLLFDISFNFGTLTNCISNSTQPGFKAGYAGMVDCAYIRNAILFFQSVSKIGSQSTADTNCSKSLAKVAEFFNCWVTVKELWFCIKNFVKDFCNLWARTFIKVFNVDCSTLLFWRLYDSLQYSMVRNVKTAGPNAALKTFAVNGDYWNWKFLL